MSHVSEIVFIIICGTIAVTIIDVIGSITSRRLNYTYAYLTPFSLIVYLLVGFFVSRLANLYLALLGTCLVGIYDATVGWKLSILLKANFGRFKESSLNMTLYSRIVGIIAISIVFGFIGYTLGNVTK